MTKDLAQRSAGPLFDGRTFDQDRDGDRLKNALERVRRLLRSGRAWTAVELAEAAGCSETGVTARVRDLRKAKFGGHVIESKCVAGGKWTYRMVS